MNKIFYTLFFLLFFSFFNNNAKAQTSSDVVACPKDGSGQILISSILGDGVGDDQTCDGEGTTNVTLKIYSLGFCTSEPTINFDNGGSAADERDNGTDGPSNFTSCRWVIKQSSTTTESLQSVGDIEPLPNDEIPPAGTYTHAVLVISNTLEITGTATFGQDIIDLADNEGRKCWTNGTYFYDTGKEGPLQGSSPETLIQYGGGGATCGPTPSPLANFIVYKYSNFEGAGCTLGCNTTRSNESTSFGNLTVYFTKADPATLATDTPNILRSTIVPGPGVTNGTLTETNTLTLVFAYNTPMVVTDKTTGMEIFLNFSNALSLDFEPTAGRDINTSSTTFPLIRAIQSGPFGIQFKPVEGGSTE